MSAELTREQVIAGRDRRLHRSVGGGMKPITECPLWRWLSGMAWRRTFAGGHSLGDKSGRILTDWDVVDSGGRIFRYPDGMEPDPGDPATFGCLLALVRDAWGHQAVCVFDRRNHADRWRVLTGLQGKIIGDGATEWEALCAALWAASERAA